MFGDSGPAVLIVFFLLGAGLLLFVGWKVADVQRKAAQAAAASMGLTYARGDPLGLLRLPHRVFRMGDRRRIDITVHGMLDGDRVALCDYVYTDVSHDDKGNTQTRDHRMSLVVLTLAANLPATAISPEGVGRKMLNALGVGNDIQFESDEFNRAFQVLSQDRDFAYTLIDPGMMEWLMAHARGGRIEAIGPDVVISSNRIRWEDMPGLAAMAKAFKAKFPRLVWERYGS